MRHPSLRAIPLITLAALCGPAVAQTEPPHPLDGLFEQIDELRQTVDTLRLALAQAKLETAQARRERDELWLFIQEHDQMGSDFENYEAVRAAAEQGAVRRRVEETRRQREAAKAQRQSKQRAIRAERDREKAEMDRVQEYRDAGFTPLGFDVYMSNAAYYYHSHDGLSARFDWNGLTGRFLRVYPWINRIDYSSMTVSGSVMNTSENVRDLGIAVTFFDDNGSQVGGEIVQVTNARPNVPYPFTATIAMALNRPFTSTSTYVLYADPSETAGLQTQTN